MSYAASIQKRKRDWWIYENVISQTLNNFVMVNKVDDAKEPFENRFSISENKKSPVQDQFKMTAHGGLV